MFGLPNDVGLVECLTQPNGSRLPVQAVSPTLWVLTAGRPSLDPMGALVSDAMRDLLTQAMETFDWVVVDTPPVAILSDAHLLAGMIDTAHSGRRRALGAVPDRAAGRQAIGASRILGVVLNRTERRELSDGYGYYADRERYGRRHSLRGGGSGCISGRTDMFRRTWRSLVLAAGETVLLVTAVAVSSYVYLGAAAWDALTDAGGMLRVLLIVFVCQVCLHYSDLYDLGSIAGHPRPGDAAAPRDRRDLFDPRLRLFHVSRPGSSSAACFVLSAALAISLVVAWRYVFDVLATRVAPRERLLLVGTSPGAVTLARELFQRRLELGVDIVGFVDPDPARIGAPVINPGVVGAIDDIPFLVSKYNVDRVVVSLSDTRGKLPDGSPAGRADADRRALRPSGIGLRGIHRQDRGREPPAKLARVFDRLSQDAVPDGRQARIRRAGRARRPGGRVSAHARCRHRDEDQCP